MTNDQQEKQFIGYKTCEWMGNKIMLSNGGVMRVMSLTILFHHNLIDVIFISQTKMYVSGFILKNKRYR